MRTYVVIACLLTVSACASSRSPQLLAKYQGQRLFTCCNIRYEKNEVSDANYHVGTLLPAGTTVNVIDAGRRSVTVDAGTTKLTLSQDYGAEQESIDQYIDKILLRTDSQARIAAEAADVQAAIHEGRVEIGMTRDQVLLSLGYPPTHRTPSLSSSEWTYWYNRWLTFKVVFDDKGVVSNLIGGDALTKHVAIELPKPAPVKKVEPKRAPKKH